MKFLNILICIIIDKQKQRCKEKIIIIIINMVAYYLIKHVTTKSSAKHVDRLL